tara:strand:+ start:707 stop:1426 length:720 start_codon:yes stop_codon:yes gene_type:complete
MLVMGVKFNDKVLIDKLNIIEKTQIPFAANQSLKRLGHLIKTQLLPAEMMKSFTAPGGLGRPVPFTLRALTHSTKDMTLTLSIKKEVKQGISPAEYLYSAFYGGDVTMSPLTSAVKGITGQFGVPVYGNLARLGGLTQRLDIKRTYASSIVSGLSNDQSRRNQPKVGERFVHIKENSRYPIGPAIYRIKGNSVARIMNLVDTKPKVGVSLEYETFITKTAEQRLPSLLSLELQRAMASR